MSKSQPSEPDSTTNPRRRLSHVLTPAVEDYLKTIYKLQGPDSRATTIAIAQRMGISPASVTNMLRKLGQLGLVDYQRYQGARLTEIGERVALEIIRHHRLLELYLTELMGYSWDQVDAEAEQLEHVISEEFEDRIDRMLGHPQTDPHGAPIPTPEGYLPTTRYTPLSEVGQGARVVVRRVSDRDAEVLRQLGRIGLFPGVALRVTAHAPRGLTVQLADRSETHTVPIHLAQFVFVEPAWDSFSEPPPTENEHS